MLTVIIVVGGISFVVLFNVLFHRYTIRRAIKKYIRPKLEEKGYELKNFKFAGIFSKGDFENDKEPFLPFFSAGGSPVNNIYAYLYLNRKDEAITKRVTVELRTFFFAIEKVSFLPEL
jgi:hypothetical protein